VSVHLLRRKKRSRCHLGFMLEEGVSGMERKGTPRQSSAAAKSNGAVERKNGQFGSC
jgi:hypothetical protein